jgi:cytoskeletal protein RodZ
MSSTTNTLKLEQVRRNRGVSLEQIAESTKISTRFLRAIECEEFDKLPGGVFNTNYIRQYASAIGHPADAVLAQYNSFEAARQAEEQNIVPVRKTLPVRWVSWLRGTAPFVRS